MGLKKVQKQGRDEKTRIKTISSYRKVVVKKDWKTTLLLSQKLSQATEVEQSSSLSLPRLFGSWIVLILVFSSPSFFCTFFRTNPTGT